MTRRARLLVALAVALTLSLIFVATLVTIRFVDTRNQIARRFDDCTNPGPRKPTAADPSTGHPCYDRGQAQLAQAIATIELRQGCLAAVRNGLPDPPACAGTDRQLRADGFIP